MRNVFMMVFLMLSLSLITGCFSKEPEQTVAKPKPTDESKASSTVPVKEASQSLNPTEQPKEENKLFSGSVSKEGAKSDASSSVKTEASNKPKQAALPQEAQPAQPEKPIVTEEQVKQKYIMELKVLQKQYSGELSGLYNTAISDLKSGKDAKDIYSKYAKAGIAIKEESQGKVNQVLFQMKEELKANQLPTGSIDQLRVTYYQELDQAKSGAMAKVKQALGF